MAESMQGLKRTHRCTEVSNANIGETVTVMGWVAKQRNKGGIIFVDLRDRSGILQIIFEEDKCGAEGFAKAEKIDAKSRTSAKRCATRYQMFQDTVLYLGRAVDSNCFIIEPIAVKKGNKWTDL